MAGIVWKRVRGELVAELELGDRAAVLRAAAQVEAWSDDVVVGLEFGEAGGWTVVAGDDDVWALVREGERAWREEQWQKRQERLKAFVPEPLVSVSVRDPAAPVARGERAEWAVLGVFRGQGAQAQADALLAQLGAPSWRVRLTVGETKP